MSTGKIFETEKKFILKNMKKQFNDELFFVTEPTYANEVFPVDVCE